MDCTSEDARRKEFKEILLDLAKSQDLLKEPKRRFEFYCKLESLYHIPENESNFRHFYSDIFSILTLIRQDDSFGNIDILGQNLAELRKGYQKNKRTDVYGKPIDISDSLRKLYDHVSLDIARLSYSEANDKQIAAMDNIRNLKDNVNHIQNKVTKAEDKLGGFEKSIQNTQKEYVAILSIFAAIVLTFTGGISFSHSTMDALVEQTVTDSHLVIMATVCGFILFNSIAVLLYMVSRIIDKPIWSACKAESCDTCKENEKCKTWLQKIQKRLPFVFWVDAAFVLIFLIAWFC